MRTMFLAAALTVATTSLAARAHADPIELCRQRIDAPENGATSVPLDLEITGSSSCSGLDRGPKLLDESGAEVPTTLSPESSTFTLRPNAPLLADHDYRIVTVGSGCAGIETTRFSTAAAPALVEVRSEGTTTRLQGFALRLSEPLSDALSDDAVASLVGVSLANFDAPAVCAPQPERHRVRCSFGKEGAPRESGSRVRIVLRAGLAFASGVTLDADRVRLLSMADGGATWMEPELSDTDCSTGGCSARRGGSSRQGTAVAALLVAAMLGLSLRRLATRRTRPASAPCP